MTAPARRPDAPTEEAVAAFLRARPGFLADRPELYRMLLPPARVHGERLADHMAAMLRAERVHAAAMAARADGVLAAGRAAASLALRVQEAVLALIAAADPAECIAAELPGLLGIDAAVLCLERDRPHARRLPAGRIAALLGGRDVVFRSRPGDAGLLHAEAAPLARHDALVRVRLADAPALLALACRDAAGLDPAQGCGALGFLGRAAAAALAAVAAEAGTRAT